MTNPGKILSKLPVPKEGAIVEFGCFDGSSMKTLLQHFPDRELWGFDTFEGMPKQGFIEGLDNPSNKPGKFNTNKDIEKELNELGVHTIKGTYCSSLLKQIDPLKIAAVYLDCDWYVSYRDALSWVTHRLVDGAVIVYDEYHTTHKGAVKAVDEWCQEHNQTVINNSYTIWSKP